jgi:hypothetical protein
MRIIITSEGLSPLPCAEGQDSRSTPVPVSIPTPGGTVGRQEKKKTRRRRKGTKKTTTMTNPPSVASQGSGGTQSYPKSILKKSVQAAFEGEMPTINHHHHYHHHHPSLFRVF